MFASCCIGPHAMSPRLDDSALGRVCGDTWRAAGDRVVTSAITVTAASCRNAFNGRIRRDLAFWALPGVQSRSSPPVRVRGSARGSAAALLRAAAATKFGALVEGD